MRQHSAMLLSDLQDQLRAVVREGIEAGEVTTSRLALRAGFAQAQLRGFLNRRRGLKAEAMDRVMEEMGVDVLDLVSERPDSPAEKAIAQAIDVPVVKPGALLRAQLGVSDVKDVLRFHRSFLSHFRSQMVGARKDWQRFVLIEVKKRLAAAMHPRLEPGAMLLVDRHYNSLRRYRRSTPNLYVVSKGADWQVCYVEARGERLMLRPEDRHYPLDFIRPEQRQTMADYVVGRVAHIAMEA